MSNVPDERGPRVGLKLPLVCGSVVVLCAAWALVPLRGIDAPIAAAAPAITAVASSTPPKAELDLAAFRVPLWVVQPPPTPPPEPPAPPPPPPPIRLQLLAIVREAGGLRASIYDPEADRIVLVGAGEAVGRRTVASVSETAVTLREGDRGHTLVLERVGPPAGGGGR